MLTLPKDWLRVGIRVGSSRSLSDSAPVSEELADSKESELGESVTVAEGEREREGETTLEASRKWTGMAPVRMISSINCTGQR